MKNSTVNIELTGTGIGPHVLIKADEESLEQLVHATGEAHGGTNLPMGILHQDLQHALNAIRALKGEVPRT